jgi:hypothetical protein
VRRAPAYGCPRGASEGKVEGMATMAAQEPTAMALGCTQLLELAEEAVRGTIRLLEQCAPTREERDRISGIVDVLEHKTAVLRKLVD